MKIPRALKTAAATLLLAQAAWSSPVWPPDTFSCYYGELTEQAIQELKEIDLVVVHPGDDTNLSADKIKSLRGTGREKTIVGYVSIGEDDRPPGGPPIKGEDTSGPSFVDSNLKIAKANKGYPAQFLDQRRLVLDSDGFLAFGRDGKPITEKGQDGLPDENGVWGSFYVRTDEQAWKDHVFQAMDRLVAMGADGFFLDTVDTASPWGDYGWTSSAMLEFVKEIRSRYPDKRIVANRGLFYLSQNDSYGKAIDAVLFESLLTHYNWESDTGEISPWAKWHVISLDDEVIPAQKRTGVHLLVLDYLNPKQKDALQLVQSDRTLLQSTPHSLSFSHPNLQVPGWTAADLLPDTQPAQWPTLQKISLLETGPGDYVLTASFSGPIPDQAWPDLRVTSRDDVKPERAAQLAPAQVKDWKVDGNTLMVSGTGLEKNQKYTAYLRLISKAKSPQTGFGWTSFTTAQSDLPAQVRNLSSSSVPEGVALKFEADSLLAKSYRVYAVEGKDRRLLQEATNSPAILDLPLKQATHVVVVGVGADGKPGYPSEEHTVVRRDVVAPPSPGKVTFEQKDTMSRFSWESSSEASSYRLYVVPQGQKFRLPSLVSETTLEVENVVPGRYRVFLTAVDDSGNQSRPGPETTIEVK